MKRKLVALILAATMVAGTGLTASAADTTATIDAMDKAGAGQEITGAGEVNLPTIKVTVPTTADIVINPYQMEYTKDGDTDPLGSSQIISAEQEITNESNVAVAVNVVDLTATEVAEGVTISTTALTDKVTTKSAFLYLEVVKDDTDFAAAYNAKAANQVVVPYVKEGDTKTKKGAKDAIVTLEAGDTTATKAKFKIGGSVVANPTKLSEDKKSTIADTWSEEDKFGISFKFTFTPQVIPATKN